MDKFEYKVKVDEIMSLIQSGAYEDAVDVADTVDWSTVKNVRTLGIISDLYKKNRLFEESRTVLLYAYNRQKARPIVKSLCELSIELGDLISAIELCKEFIQIAPKDPDRYILQYKIYRAQGISLEEQIEALEEYKSQHHDPKWAYELAELYHKVGMEDRCVAECDEMILWFVDGKYVIKAYELKALHKPLTEQEVYKYELLQQAGGELNIQYSLREEEPKEEPEKKDLEVRHVDVSPYNTQNLQAVVAEGLQDYFDQRAAVNQVEEAKELDDMVIEASAPEVDPELMVTQMYNPVIAEPPVGQELAEDEEESAERDSLTDSAILGDIAAEMAADRFKEREFVLNQDTDEIKMITPEEEASVDTDENEDMMQSIVSKSDIDIPVRPDFSNTGIIETFHKGSNMDDILSQEYDGQISLVVPETSSVEKQITGQISIDDVMLEWERKKKENEARRIANVKEKVRKQTNGLLADFDEATKSGLLEQIENAMISAALKEEQERIAAARPKQIKVSDIESLDNVQESTPKKSAEEIQLEEAEEIVMEALKEEISPAEVKSTKNSVKEPEETDEVEEIEEIEETEETEEDSDEALEELESIEAVVEETTSEEVDEEEESESAEEETFEVEEDDEVLEEEDSEDTDNEPKLRVLSEGERERFAAFIHHKSTQKQLAEALDNISLASYTGNVLVTSEEDSEITTFSKLLVKEIQSSDSNFTGKVAKVSGENLNRKDIKDTLKCVSNGALIISEAEGLKKKTVEILIKELQHSDRGVVVVMQGHSDVIDKIVAKNEGMSETFNLRIDLRAFDNKTLVEYAKTYAYDNEYSIDELGILALHTRIDDMQTADHEVTLSEIEDIIEDAIYYANKKTPKHFFDILLGKRYDDDDMVILREKDFMHY